VSTPHERGSVNNSYIENINQILRPKEQSYPVVLDLFAGCGGLALGFEAQGFATVGYEKDKDACATYRHNLHGECHCVVLKPEMEFPQVPVIIGGPPCQPFSVIGSQKGSDDERNGFPVFVAAVAQIKPEIWLFENVRGVYYRSKPYFESIMDELRALGYVVEATLLNAVNYGVPQNRERVIVVGHRGHFQFPRPVSYRVSAGEAICDTTAATPPESKFLTLSMDKYIAEYERKSCCVRPRDLHFDQPARTLTCRNLAGATSDMHRIRLPDGRRRRLLQQEAARLQSFPDSFAFIGNETSVFNQIGNAVPPLFASHLAASVRAYLETTERKSTTEIERAAQPLQLSLL